MGSNLGNRRKNCLDALYLLSSLPEIEVVRRSNWYETEPVGIDTSNWFINGVAEILTSLDPQYLLDNLVDIERSMGRDRFKTSDRPIDLDLLFMEGVFVDTVNSQGERINIPHIRLADRRFVLAPWTELAPDLMLRPWGKTVSELLSELPEHGPVVQKSTT